LLILINCLQIF